MPVRVGDFQSRRRHGTPLGILCARGQEGDHPQSGDTVAAPQQIPRHDEAKAQKDAYKVVSKITSHATHVTRHVSPNGMRGRQFHGLGSWPAMAATDSSGPGMTACRTCSLRNASSLMEEKHSMARVCSEVNTPTTAAKTVKIGTSPHCHFFCWDVSA